MDKKNKKELIQIIEEQNKNITLYKTRLRDIIESYKNLQKEKEILENSIKTLTESDLHEEKYQDECAAASGSEIKTLSNKTDTSIQKLKNSLGALTTEKTRIENELRTDRKKLLQQKDELERKLCEKENEWFLEKERCSNQVLELKKKIGTQQREREKEQQDHVQMLKELQNLLGFERAAKEKYEAQIGELQQKSNPKLPEKKITEYEKIIEDIQNKLITSQDRLRNSENEVQRNLSLLKNFQDEINELKSQYMVKLSEEKSRLDKAEEELKLHTLFKEKRITTLENRISELSEIVGDHDKLHQQDQLTIQKLKARISQLQMEYSTYSNAPNDGNLWELKNSDNSSKEKSHDQCQLEITRLSEEVGLWKSKAEARFNEKIQKTSSGTFSDARITKELKESKSRITQLEDQLHTCKSQLKLNEDYHSKITTNLEKSCEDQRLHHKQQLSQIEVNHRVQLLEFEHQIQKQRERTLSLLEEKDKEIGHLKSSFLSPFFKRKEPSPNDSPTHEDSDNPNIEEENSGTLLPSSLISSKKDGHILHYLQELSRKDIEISNLRQSRVQTESNLRKLQQSCSDLQITYKEEVESLKSRIKLLECSQDKEGTNVEYLKNVVLRFLKCSNPASRKHMINAISTILHFTSSEVQDIKLL